MIFPKDETINFLYPIVTILQERNPKLSLIVPLLGDKGIDLDDDTELIIFLGHGTSSTLHGSVNELNEKTKFLDVPNAAIKFEESSVVLLSCRSADFLKAVKSNVSVDTFLGFGDMPTDWEHIEHIRQSAPQYLSEFKEEHLEFYKSVLVESVINGFLNISVRGSLRELYLGIKVVVNKKINEVLLNKQWSKAAKFQVIDLLNTYKNEIYYA